MTSAKEHASAQPLTDAAGRPGLDAVLAVLAAIKSLFLESPELPIPWMIGFSCHAPDRVALERLHELYGGNLHATWLDLTPEALAPHIPHGIDFRQFYFSLSVHIESPKEEAPL